MTARLRARASAGGLSEYVLLDAKVMLAAAIDSQSR